MIAGAGTAIWMALSATAASADTGASDNHSLLDYSLRDGVTSSVSSTVSAATGTVKGVATAATSTVGSVAKAAVPPAAASTVSIPVPNVPLPAPVKGVVPAKPISVPVPAVTPIVGQVGGSADEIVATVPVVSQVLPADIAGTVVGTVVAPATRHVDAAVEAAVPPVNDVLAPVGQTPVTDVATPILQPIVDVVDLVPPPVEAVVPPLAPVVPLIPGPGPSVLPVLGGDGQQAASAFETPDQRPVTAHTEQVRAATGQGGVNEVSLLYSISSVLGPTGTVPTAGAGPGADPDAPTEWPADLESVPAGVAGAGSSNSNNGPPSSAAAFLHGAVIIPAESLPGLATAAEEQHPKPVCFDPGSSPD
ncbi:hypothetical protein [Paenarthrobacter nitroguajacolicus]|nr:hypothetical protein [Paenarthrobacter nitroguajacolicus]